LRFAEIAKRDGVAGFCKDRVLETVDRGVHVALSHIVLPDFQIFFRAQGIPHRLIGRVLRGVVGIGFWLRLGRTLRRRLRRDAEHRECQQSDDCSGRTKRSSGWREAKHNPLIQSSMMEVAPGE
jgi:hypothetical protein